jgi:hypothetical protein
LENPVKRSVGLTLVGILVILLSAALVLLCVLGVFAFTTIPSAALHQPNGSPQDAKMFGFVGLGFMLVMGALGTASGIGLIRRWEWARYVTMVFGFLAAGLCALSGLMMMVVPFPPSANVSSQFMDKVRLVFVGFYLFWLVLFLAISLFLLKKNIGEEFRTPRPETPQEPRPLAVWTVAGLQLVALLSIPIFVIGHPPTFFMGMALPELPGKIFMLVWMFLYAATGVALFRRIRTAYWVAVWLYVIGLVNGLLILLPGPSARFLEVMQRYSGAGYGSIYGSGMLRFMIMVGLVSGVIPLLLLAIGRRRFFAWCERETPNIPLPQA